MKTFEQVLVDTLKLHQSLFVEIFQFAQKHIPKDKVAEIKNGLLTTKHYISVMDNALQGPTQKDGQDPPKPDLL